MGGPFRASAFHTCDHSRHHSCDHSCHHRATHASDGHQARSLAPLAHTITKEVLDRSGTDEAWTLSFVVVVVLSVTIAVAVAVAIVIYPL